MIGPHDNKKATEAHKRVSLAPETGTVASRSISTHAVIGPHDNKKATEAHRYGSAIVSGPGCKASTEAIYDLTLIARIAS